LDYDARQLETFAGSLEKSNMIIDNGGRLGVAEVTRLGMGVKEMERISSLISLTLSGKESADVIRKKVTSIASEFSEPRFVLE
jgi:glycine/serine hydroxymethyltransferase